jgi:opacity protein-like surface antigen
MIHRKILSLACVLAGLCTTNALAAQQSPVGDLDLRPYLHLRMGRAIFTEGDSAQGLELDSPSGQQSFGGSIGTDVGRYLGFELAFDYTKTDLLLPDTNAGDWALASLMLQGRFRYPLYGGRLVPYMLLGAGSVNGEFSGRRDFSLSIGGREWVLAANVGAGVDYFIFRNIALTAEAKYQFSEDQDIRVRGVKDQVAADNLNFTGGLRIYFDNLATGSYRAAADPRPAKDSPNLSWYLAARAGKALFTDTGGFAGLSIDDWGAAGPSFAVGANFNRYFGAELAFEYTRAQLRSPNFGLVSGYPVWTVSALGRARYPMLQDRLSPYLVAGVGVAYAEGGDRNQRQSLTGFDADQNKSIVGVFGAGVDYFVMHNVALNLETKYTGFFDTDAAFSGQNGKLSPEFMYFSAGVRVFFR